MQHDPSRTSPVCFFCERRPSLISACNSPPQNFAETLPTEMSVKIFGELDAESLCSASRTCKLWHDIIEDSDQLWRRQCLLVRAVCQREVYSDRRDGLSWKVSRPKKETQKQWKTRSACKTEGSCSAQYFVHFVQKCSANAQNQIMSWCIWAFFSEMLQELFERNTYTFIQLIISFNILTNKM